MSDQPTGGPEPFPTNTQETITSISGEELQATTAANSSGLLSENRKRTQSGDVFAPADPAARITTKEEIKHNQNILQEQNEKLHKEATVAASGGNDTSPLNHPKPEKEQNCIRISTQRTFVDLRDSNDNDGNAFGRYLPIDAANNHIRTALQSEAATQEVQLTRVGTTKTGYIIRFKNTESAEAAHSNTEWLHQLGNNTKLRKDAFAEIELEPDRERARDRAESAKDTSVIIIYSDASGREGYLGAAIVALDDNDEVVES
ncbi:hypothetical protein LT330_010682 [Penicillium expansum]|nr:hypothetical protein LT330_010682 [Penicillium expansum]